MAIPKQWFTLKELSEKWKCSINDLLYLGITGQLDLSFDWVLLRQEASNFSVEFTEIIDMYYCEQAKKDRELTSPIPSPKYEQNALLRFAKLSSNDIAIINKHGKVPIRTAFLSEFEYLDVYLDDNIEDLQHPFICIDDLVVTSVQVDKYNSNKGAPHSPQEKKSTRAIESDEKLIGLLTLALIDKTTGNRLTHGDKKSINQVANLLDQYRPEGTSQSGISHETIRKKLGRSVKILAPQNN
jgi:hypothetical protein